MSDGQDLAKWAAERTDERLLEVVQRNADDMISKAAVAELYERGYRDDRDDLRHLEISYDHAAVSFLSVFVDAEELCRVCGELADAPRHAIPKTPPRIEGSWPKVEARAVEPERTGDNRYEPAPIPRDSQPIAELVAEDLIERMHAGTAKYGTPLQAHNGRNALRDAYQEALDLCCYLKQRLVEEGG